MKTHLLIITVLFFGVQFGFGQANPDDYRSVIGTAGGSFQNPAVGSIEWTMGEVIAEAFDPCVLTQGFHQTGVIAGCGTTSTQTFNEDLQVSIFPNPAVDFINIQVNENVDALQVFSVDGRLMIDKRDFQTPNELDISALSHGSYYLKITVEKTFHTKSFIKIKL